MNRVPTARYKLLTDHLDLRAATGVDDARWEYFQLAHLLDDSIFRIEDKSRQIAWSWLTGAEGMADAVLGDWDSVYVSINQEEAKEKIRYARQVYEALRPPFPLPKIVRDNELGVELDNGRRLTSLPAKPPRGRARAKVYLDEFAHVQHDRKIYTAALPVISKGGRLRIGSSPLGASGVFWEVFSESLRKYPGYTRKKTPWWEVYAFCVNVAEARKLAGAMPTAHRVELFGNDRIKAIYANMPEDDFRQEYECEFVDESTAFITWEEIREVQDGALLCWQSHDKDSDISHALDAINAATLASRRGEIEPGLAVGVDIGRTRNTTEIFGVGLTTTDTRPLRLALTLDNTAFDEQYAVLSALLERLPVSKMYIDQNGLGRNLAENLGRAYPGKAEGVNFTNASKTVWATDTKMLTQQHKIALPVDREMAYQIHSIKKTVSASRNLIFDTDANEKHHADQFWALALALAAGKAGSGLTAEEIAALMRWQ